jgi:hypothetical protein
MKSHAFTSRTARKTTDAPSQHSSAGKNANALAPPAYGIDFVDRGMPALDTDRAAGGKTPGSQYAEDENIGGRTWGEFFGDVGRPVRTGLGNVLGWAAARLTGIDVTSNSLIGPTWNANGHFDWGVMFNVANGGQAGWVVQEITNTFRGTDALGNALVPAPAPHYWEAWSVDAAGNIDPTFVDARGCDDWIRMARGANTEGHWSMEGKVHFTTTDPATQGFVAGGVANAGGLLATTAAAAPAGIGVARLHRYAQGHWDSKAVPPTAHAGMAR